MCFGVGFLSLVWLNVVCYSLVVVVWFGLVWFGTVVWFDDLPDSLLSKIKDQQWTKMFCGLELVSLVGFSSMWYVIAWLLWLGGLTV